MTEDGRAPSGQALVNDAPAGHRPSGFDPSRIATAIKNMTKTQPGALMALPVSGVWATASEMRHRTSPASLDILYTMRGGAGGYRFCERRWTRWGGEPGQKRGEGYEYSITPFGDAVRQVLRDSDGSAEGGETGMGLAVGNSAGLKGIAQPSSPPHNKGSDER